MFKTKILSCATSLPSRLFSIRMQSVAIKEFGPAENMYIATDTPIPTCLPTEILIKIHASAVNRSDTLQRKGGYSVPPGVSQILGLEAAGTVEKVNAGSKWKVGDRVMALLPGGGYAEYVNVNEAHLLPIPDSLAFEQAAAIPEVWLTAYQLLHLVANVKKGDTVLIHAAASGVGTALIQLCLSAGATPIASVSTAEKQKYVEELGAAKSLNYKEEDFSAVVKEYTNGKGVNIVLDPVGAQNFAKNLDSIAEDGRWVVYGFMGGAVLDKVNIAPLLKKRVRIEATTLRSRCDEYKAHLVKEFAINELPRFIHEVDGIKHKPIVDRVLSFAEVAEAHHVIESNATIGKVVLKWAI
eukprot:TRINITY_DN12618_c0_g1_i1.p1 TRINITY_DN12618_c0_g1~~TRINITY_DN12618_c0_g1_i1.p1  ORF type:complete len:354 (+),score=124.32 TRINITY_DN12618_c0_g1_i1:21-1082(+)